MGQRLSNRTFNVPEDRPLPTQDESTSCVLIGDEAFPLKQFLIPIEVKVETAIIIVKTICVLRIRTCDHPFNLSDDNEPLFGAFEHLGNHRRRPTNIAK
ncbi:hypothetical protein NQ318_023579 [Aromia moschata]|uniref:DDE Tnp4 domain-containing protein n=1 Tax=Aromia moschata TaxID=1265417 RepID=A0AAV8YPR8_9CUCU|nr:hypothetical protein NQ318_023579 [Aromia moschata]